MLFRSVSQSRYAVSPDGTKLVLGGNFAGGSKLYSVSESSLIFISDIPSGSVNAVAFSPDGTKLVLGTKLYSVSGSSVTFISNIPSVSV